MKTTTLSIPGFNIACKIWGNPKNPPILALHGWLDNANSFNYLAPYLEKDFYLIAIDLPGHGHSSHLPAGCYYHFTDALFTLVEILDALHLNKVHLLGHSMGACLASLFGGIAPQRLLSLGLIEGLGPFSAPGSSACTQLAQYMSYLSPAQKPPAKGYPDEDTAAQIRATKGYVSLDIAKTLTERGLHQENGRFQWRHDKRLTTPTPLRLTEEQVLSCLTQISVPTSLIWASKGFSFDSDLMQARVKAIEGLKLFHLDGGHHIHMEQAETVAQVLTDFYKNRS